MGWFVIQERQGQIDISVQDRAAFFAGALQRELNTQIELLSLVAESPRLDLPVSRSSFTETARRLTARLPSWEQVRVTNDKGEIVLSYPPLSPNASKTVIDKQSHDEVLRSEVGVVGNMLLGSRGLAAFAVRVPIQRSGRTKAVLSAVIRPEMITRILNGAGLPQGWSAWVIDSQERLVAATDGAGHEARPSSEFARDVGGADVELHNGSSLHIAEAALPSTSWRVRVGLPSAEYNRPANQATLLLLLTSALMVTLCAIAAVLSLRELRARADERESLANWQRMDALGKLTGQAAHDFNNLLMVFQSGVEGIEKRRNDEERVTRLLAHMKEGLARGKNITRRLLSFARRSNQGAEHIEVEHKITEMATLLRQALNDSIVFDVVLPADLWAVHADPVGLEIALINLLTNAREAMSDGGKVTLSGRNVLEGAYEDKALKGPMVALTITDTGAGIAAADLQRIFEPFFSSKAQGGAGLGLTQVHGFALGSGGMVKAASLPGHGSAFTLFLPKSNEAPRVADGPTKSDLPERILIVDDTPASLESARLTLDGLATIIKANSGAEALRLMEKEQGIGAVISDIMMPGMSGIELAQHLAQTHPALPVVLMTGYSDKLEAGLSVERPVLMKPFSADALLKALAAAKSSRPDLTNVVRLDKRQVANEAPP
jgi:signal transduction histidine kinase/ActR/RegA family two-component response regulator